MYVRTYWRCCSDCLTTYTHQRLAPPISVGFINAQSNLRISSDGVEYTNDTLYAPFGSSLVLTCEGGVGEERWYTENFDGSKAYLRTDSSATVYQSSGQLFVGDFQSRQAENIFCEDMVLSTVFTALMEGVLIAWCCYIPVLDYALANVSFIFRCCHLISHCVDHKHHSLLGALFPEHGHAGLLLQGGAARHVQQQQ